MKSLLMMSLMVPILALAAPASKPTTETKSKSKGKSHSFESQLVEGEIYRPDYSVVTGESPTEGWGVIRLRAKFDDHARTDAEEAKK